MARRIVTGGSKQEEGGVLDLFEVVLTGINVLKERGQKPQLMRQALLNHLNKVRKNLAALDKSGLIPTDSWIINPPIITKKGQIVAGIYNDSPLFGTLLSGSATRNVDNTGGPPYDIFPVNSEFLAIHFKGGGEKGAANTIGKRIFTAPGIAKTAGNPFSLGGETKGIAASPVGPGGISFGTDSKGKKTVSVSVTNRNSNRSKLDPGKVNKVFRATYANSNDDGDVLLVRAIYNHPGRPPDLAFRSAFLNLLYSEDPDDDIPGQIMAAFSAGIDPKGTTTHSPEDRFSGFNQRKPRKTGPDLIVPIVGTADTMVIPGNIEISTRVSLPENDPYLKRLRRK